MERERWKFIFFILIIFLSKVIYAAQPEVYFVNGTDINSEHPHWGKGKIPILYDGSISVPSSKTIKVYDSVSSKFYDVTVNFLTRPRYFVHAEIDDTFYATFIVKQDVDLSNVTTLPASMNMISDLWCPWIIDKNGNIVRCLQTFRIKKGSITKYLITRTSYGVILKEPNNGTHLEDLPPYVDPSSGPTLATPIKSIILDLKYEVYAQGNPNIVDSEVELIIEYQGDFTNAFSTIPFKISDGEQSHIEVINNPMRIPNPTGDFNIKFTMNILKIKLATSPGEVKPGDPGFNGLKVQLRVKLKSLICKIEYDGPAIEKFDVKAATIEKVTSDTDYEYVYVKTDIDLPNMVDPLDPPGPLIFKKAFLSPEAHYTYTSFPPGYLNVKRITKKNGKITTSISPSAYVDLEIDGSTDAMLYTNPSSGKLIWEPTPGSPYELLDPGTSPCWPSFSPDGKQAIFYGKPAYGGACGSNWGLWKIDLPPKANVRFGTVLKYPSGVYPPFYENHAAYFEAYGDETDSSTYISKYVKPYTDVEFKWELKDMTLGRGSPIINSQTEIIPSSSVFNAPQITLPLSPYYYLHEEGGEFQLSLYVRYTDPGGVIQEALLAQKEYDVAAFPPVIKDTIRFTVFMVDKNLESGGKVVDIKDNVNNALFEDVTYTFDAAASIDYAYTKAERTMIGPFGLAEGEYNVPGGWESNDPSEYNGVRPDTVYYQWVVKRCKYSSTGNLMSEHLIYKSNWYHLTGRNMDVQPLTYRFLTPLSGEFTTDKYRYRVELRAKFAEMIFKGEEARPAYGADSDGGGKNDIYEYIEDPAYGSQSNPLYRYVCNDTIPQKHEGQYIDYAGYTNPSTPPQIVKDCTTPLEFYINDRTPPEIKAMEALTGTTGDSLTITVKVRDNDPVYKLADLKGEAKVLLYYEEIPKYLADIIKGNPSHKWVNPPYNLTSDSWCAAPIAMTFVGMAGELSAGFANVTDSLGKSNERWIGDWEIWSADIILPYKFAGNGILRYAVVVKDTMGNVNIADVDIRDSDDPTSDFGANNSQIETVATKIDVNPIILTSQINRNYADEIASYGPYSVTGIVPPYIPPSPVQCDLATDDCGSIDVVDNDRPDIAIALKPLAEYTAIPTLKFREQVYHLASTEWALGWTDTTGIYTIAHDDKDIESYEFKATPMSPETSVLVPHYKFKSFPQHLQFAVYIHLTDNVLFEGDYTGLNEIDPSLYFNHDATGNEAKYIDSVSGGSLHLFEIKERDSMPTFFIDTYDGTSQIHDFTSTVPINPLPDDKYYVRYVFRAPNDWDSDGEIDSTEPVYFIRVSTRDRAGNQRQLVLKLPVCPVDIKSQTLEQKAYMTFEGN